MQQTIHYLATFDSANASLRWPQIDAATANLRQAQYYDTTISHAFKMNLLWRPAIAIRHKDLLNNFALAKFIRDHLPECRQLADAGLLRACAQFGRPFQDIFEDWCLGGGPEQPMHWHHQSPESRHEYLSASREGRFQNWEDVEPFLHLQEHRLTLAGLFQLYDSLFPQSEIIIVEPESNPKFYKSFCSIVERKWERYLKDRREFGLPTKAVFGQIEKTLETCCQAVGRRRVFYTDLEDVEDLLSKKGQFDDDIQNSVAETKCFVVNDAFFDAVEIFGRTATGIVLPSRDITNVWSVEDLEQTAAEKVSETAPEQRQQNPEPALSVDFAPLDSITFADIVEFHTATHEEATAFQNSVRTLRELEDRKLRGDGIQLKQITACVTEHLHNVRKCVERRLSERQQSQVIQQTSAEVFFGVDPRIAIASTVSSCGIAALAYSASLWPVLGLLATPLFSFVLTRKVLTDRWKQCEAILGQQMTEELQT